MVKTYTKTRVKATEAMLLISKADRILARDREAAISIERCSLQKLRADSARVTFDHRADRPVRYIRGHTVDQVDSEIPS
jgi:hypothetical protein